MTARMLQLIVSTHDTKAQALTAAEALVGCQTDYLVDVEPHRARWAVVVMHDMDSDATVLANLLQAMLRVSAAGWRRPASTSCKEAGRE